MMVLTSMCPPISLRASFTNGAGTSVEHDCSSGASGTVALVSSSVPRNMPFLLTSTVLSARSTACIAQCAGSEEQSACIMCNSACCANNSVKLQPALHSKWSTDCNITCHSKHLHQDGT
eukprot:3022-Heterococcus_DN1.PRE.3